MSLFSQIQSLACQAWNYWTGSVTDCSAKPPISEEKERFFYALSRAINDTDRLYYSCLEEKAPLRITLSRSSRRLLDGFFKINEAYRAVQNGNMPTAHGVFFTCMSSEVLGSVKCLPSYSHYESPLPKNNSLALRLAGALSIMTMPAIFSNHNCYRLDYEYTPSSVTLNVSDAAPPVFPED